MQVKNIFVYAIRKSNTSTDHNQTITFSVLSIVNEGKLPDGSKYEAFIYRNRVPIGDRTVVPDLPKVLSEHVSLKPLFDIIRR